MGMIKRTDCRSRFPCVNQAILEWYDSGGCLRRRVASGYVLGGHKNADGCDKTS